MSGAVVDVAIRMLDERGNPQYIFHTLAADGMTTHLPVTGGALIASIEFRARIPEQARVVHHEFDVVCRDCGEQMRLHDCDSA